MKRFQKKLAALLLLLLSVDSRGLQAQQKTSVLFLGNSYTFPNTTPKHIRKLARAAQREVYVAIQAKGGWKLKDHLTRCGFYVTLFGKSAENLSYPAGLEERCIPGCNAYPQVL